MPGATSPHPSDIHDAVLTPLAAGANSRQTILAFEDHLLRRFGSAEVVRLGSGQVFRVLRGKADEIWALIEGAVVFDLEDERSSSPTFGRRQSIRMDTPTRLLVPFGVRLLVRPDSQTILLRLMSHTEREDPPVAETS